METQSQSRRKFMVFRVGNDRYCTPLSDVREVIGVPTITPVPQVASYMKGLINLRGQIISVIDLAEKFGMDPTESKPQETCVMISTIGKYTIGTLVGEVLEVLSIEEDSIEPTENHEKTDIITGVIRVNDDAGILLLLDLGKVFTKEELELLHQSKQVA